MISTPLTLSKGRARVVLSLTPLIDVVFILLVFFMLVSQFATWQQVEMLPQASMGEQTTDLTPLVITVDANDTLIFNGQKVRSASEVAIEVSATVSVEQPVIVRPLEGATIQPVISIVEALAQADIKNVRVDDGGTKQ